MSWDTRLLEDLEAIRRPGRDPALIQRIGETLRQFLAPTKWATDEARILESVTERRRVILTIRSAAAELYALPWELLTIESTGQHVGELPSVLLRYEWPDTHSISPEVSHLEPGRILLAWSAAAGATPAAEHIAAVRKAGSSDGASFDFERDVVPNVSCRRLSEALTAATKAGRPVAILHLLCHGSAAGTTFGLALNSDESDESAVVVDAGRLRQLLAPHGATLRLVVLAACDSGNSGALGNQLGSVAQTLHRAGIAAVVASRYPLSVSGSIRLAESLYAELCNTRSLESALLEARQRLAENAGQLDWASLQVYARAEDGADTHPLTSVPSRRLSAQNRSARWWPVLFGAVLALGGAGVLLWHSLHKPPLSVIPVETSTASRGNQETRRPVDAGSPAATATGTRTEVVTEKKIRAKGDVNVTAPAAHTTVITTKGEIDSEGDVNIGVTAPAPPVEPRPSKRKK